MCHCLLWLSLPIYLASELLLAVAVNVHLTRPIPVADSGFVAKI